VPALVNKFTATSTPRNCLANRDGMGKPFRSNARISLGASRCRDAPTCLTGITIVSLGIRSYRVEHMNTRLSKETSSFRWGRNFPKKTPPFVRSHFPGYEKLPPLSRVFLSPWLLRLTH